MKQRPADWMAWSLQFIFGAFIFYAGGKHGIFRWTSSQSFIDMDHPMAVCFLTGCALVGGGIASRWGDRFWVGDEYRVIPPDGIDHNRLSRFLSHLSMASGLVLLAVALFGGR